MYLTDLVLLLCQNCLLVASVCYHILFFFFFFFFLLVHDEKAWPVNFTHITLQRSKLIFSISRLLATFIFKMVANGKFRSPKIVVSLTQDTSYYLHEGATAERCVRK